MNETLVEKLTSTVDGLRAFQQETFILRITEEMWKGMEKRGVSVSELARRMGKRESFILRVLAGGHSLTLRLIADVFTALDLEIHTLYVSDIANRRKLQGPSARRAEERTGGEP